jgi:hypothetical protein
MGLTGLLTEFEGTNPNDVNDTKEPRGLSLSDMVSDPIVQALMQADGVDAGALKIELLSIMRRRRGTTQ